MSQQLINLSSDLRRLRDEGYDIVVQASYLLIKDVPYVNSDKKVCLGTLVSELTLAGNITTTPKTHVVYFAGEHPCNKDGSTISQIAHRSQRKELDRDLVVDHSFSSKPTSGKYQDFYEKMVTYIAIISNPAESLDPHITAKTFPVIETETGESIFVYEDTASSRAEIMALTRKLEIDGVGIVGLGGTGSYVLDFIAKTPVKEIRIFDGDTFSQHNAFRAPGAPSIDELRKKPRKVDYFKQKYSKIHRNIKVYGYVDSTNVSHLQGLNFVFLCLDEGESKRPIIEKLEEFRIPFIDVGMGIELRENVLGGILRVTTSTPVKRTHVWEKNRIPLSNGHENNEYSGNIQVADLNALNAALAVIKWKKLFGFYDDLENEHFSAYTLDGNCLVNEDCL